MNGNLIDRQKAIVDVESDAISRQAVLDVLNDGVKLLRRVLEETDIVGAARVKYEWGLGLIESCIADVKELSSIQSEVYKPVSMEEVAAELGASTVRTVHTALSFGYCLQMLDFLGFSICKKEVNNKGENNNVNDKS